MKKSYSTNDQSQGVGAKRDRDLLPAGGVEETVQGWTPNEQLVVSIDSSKKSPIKHALATFDLSPVDEGKTTVAVDEVVLEALFVERPPVLNHSAVAETGDAGLASGHPLAPSLR